MSDSVQGLRLVHHYDLNRSLKYRNPKNGANAVGKEMGMHNKALGVLRDRSVQA